MKQATLFHPEGDYVTDFRDSNSIQEVWDGINNMGSRWIFYPICFVTNGKTILDTPTGVEWMKRKRIKTIQRYLKKEWDKRADQICEAVNYGAPLGYIYPVNNL